jgi:hypothetical protein
MKKKTYLHTSFIKFKIFEKNDKNEKLPDEETNNSDKEIVNQFDNIMNADKIEKDEVQDIEEKEKDTIEELIKEYNEMEAKYKSLKNIKLHCKKN